MQCVMWENGIKIQVRDGIDVRIENIPEIIFDALKGRFCEKGDEYEGAPQSRSIHKGRVLQFEVMGISGENNLATINSLFATSFTHSASNLKKYLYNLTFNFSRSKTTLEIHNIPEPLLVEISSRLGDIDITLVKNLRGAKNVIRFQDFGDEFDLFVNIFNINLGNSANNSDEPGFEIVN